MRSYDYVIIGGGAAGFAAAIRANELGVKAALVNDGLPLGGTCVNVGCVPSKHLLHVAAAAHLTAKWQAGARKPRFDLAAVMAGKNRLVSTLRAEKYERVLAGLSNVTLVPGRAQFASSHEIEVAGEVIEAERFLIATGSSPQVPAFPGIEEVDYLTSTLALSLTELPRSMIVIGGRAVALEFAQMYGRLGTQVIVLQRSPRLIPEHEPVIAEALRGYLEEENIAVRTEVAVKRLRRRGQDILVEAEVAGRPQCFAAEKLLLATGVHGNTAGMGLEAAGVNIGRGSFVEVDSLFRTSADHIFAAGDVAGPPHLETVAAKAGKLATENALLGTEQAIDYSQVPAAIFTSPEVATVGLTEEQALERFGACSCRTLWFEDLPKARVVGDTKGLVKMVVHPDSGQVLGVHILASLAADMIHEATLAVKFGLRVDDLIDSVHVFPTLSEAIKLVAQAFRREVKKMSCCVE